jgi:hypothetical protein
MKKRKSDINKIFYVLIIFVALTVFLYNLNMNDNNKYKTSTINSKNSPQSSNQFSNLINQINQLVFKSPDAIEAITISSCPYTISSPGDYDLSGDFSGDDLCITIQASNVNLNGWNSVLGRRNRITMTGTASSCGGDGYCAIWISSGDNITITNLESSAGIIKQYGLSRNITIKDSILNGTNIYGADDVTIQNNILQGLLLTRRGDGCSADMAYRFKIIGNNITTGEMGVMPSDCRNQTIVGGVTIPACYNFDIKGLIENNTVTQPAGTGRTALLYFRGGVSNSTIRNNRFISIAGTLAGVYMRDGASYNLIENNYIESTDNARSALFFSGGNEFQDPTSNIFRNNTFKGINSDAVVIITGDSNTFENNLLWSQGNGVYGNNGIAGINETLIHNTFYHQGSSSYVINLWKNGNYTLKNNIFYSSASPNMLSCENVGVIGNYSGNNNLFNGTASANLCGYSLTNWRTLTNGNDSNSIEADPKFVNVAAGDFRLQSSSLGCNINGGYAGAYPCAAPPIGTYISSCPYTISSPGNYYLSGDLNYTNTCIILHSSNVTIDGWNSALGRRNKITLSGTITYKGSQSCDDTSNYCAVDTSGASTNLSNITITNLESNAEVRQMGRDLNITISNSVLKGIIIRGGDDATIKNNTLTRLLVTTYTPGVICSSDVPYRFRIIGNNITTDTGDDPNGILITSAPSPLDVQNAGQSCYFWDIKGLIENNTLSKVAPSSLSTVYFGDGVSNITIRNNIINSPGYGTALLLRDGPNNNLIENNYITGKDSDAYAALNIHGGNLIIYPNHNIFRNNTFKGINTHGINVGAGDSNTFENNLIWTTGSLSEGASKISGPDQKLIHNTFYHEGASSPMIFFYSTVQNINFSNNIVHSNSSANIFVCQNDATVVSYYSGNNNLFNGTPSASLCGRSLTPWKTATGEDSNSIEANPLFVNVAAGDFRLQSSSLGCNINGGYAGAYSCSGSQNYTCLDSDSSGVYPTLNYTLQGTATYSTNSSTDFCFNSSSLTEFYCGSLYGYIYNLSYNCPNGCYNGACNLTAIITYPIISNSGSSSITNSSAIITWTTDVSSSSLVKYGTAHLSYTNQSIGINGTSHTVTLSGLIPSTTYYYVVNSTDSNGRSNQSTEYIFTTLQTTADVIECVPLTCEGMGKNCNVMSDGCGGTLNCGTCSGSETCGAGGTPNVCSTGVCVPKTCNNLGFNCGITTDGCGTTLNCGSCTSPNVCGGSGTANVCETNNRGVTAITPGDIELYPKSTTIGVRVNYVGDSNSNSNAYLEYRKLNSSTWIRGVNMNKLANTTVSKYAGSVFWLTADTSYEVRVTITDSDGGAVYSGITRTWKDYPTQVTGTTRYVNVNIGNDSNSGTIGSPLKTIQRAVTLSYAGDRVLVQPGVYYEAVTSVNSGNSTAPIHIIANGSDVILDGSNPSLLNRNDWQLYSTNVYYIPFTATTSLVVADYDQKLFPHTSLSNLQTGYTGYTGEYIYQGWFTDGVNLYVRLEDGSSPNGHTMHISNQFAGFALYNDYYDIQGFTIRFYGSGAGTGTSGIVARDSGNHFIAHNYVYNIGGISIWVRRDNSRNTIIQQNSIKDTRNFYWPWDSTKNSAIEQTNGIGDRGKRGTTIRFNRISGTNNGIGGDGAQTLGEDGSSDMDINNNVISEVADDAIETDYNGVNMRVYKNTVNNIFDGISLGPNFESPEYVIYNTFSNYSRDGLKLALGGNGYALFAHNSLYSTTTQPPIFPASAFSNVHFRNNILYGTNIETVSDDGENVANNDFDYDLLYRTNTGTLFRWNAINYNNITSLRTATGFEMNGKVGNPLFVDPNNLNFSLQSNSPAIDSGVLIYGINNNFSGSAPDMGAYENKSGTILDTTAPIISGISSYNITTSGVIINWTTNETANSIIKFGTSSGVYTSSASDPDYVLLHSIILSGLNPGTTYYYVINSSDPSGNSVQSAQNAFITNSAGSSSITFISPTPANGSTLSNPNVTINMSLNAPNGVDKLVLKMNNNNYSLPDGLSCSFENNIDSDNGVARTGYGLTYVTGKFGQSVVVDSTDGLSYVNNNVYTTDEGTIMFWVSPQISWNLATNYVLFDNYNTSSSNGLMILKSANYNIIRCLATTDIGARTIDYPSTSFTQNSWNHIAINYGNNNVSLYINGVIVGSNTSGNFAYFNPNIYLGVRRDGLYQSNAAFDEFNIFKTKLSSQEINNIYNKESGEYYISFVDLANGTYLYNSSLYDSLGSKTDSSTRNFTIGTLALDTQPPTFSNIINPSNNNYSRGASYTFNVTVADNVAIDKVWIEHNFQGTRRNITVSTSGSNPYSYTINDLGAGSYLYKWYANDTNGNIASTLNQLFVISKAVPSSCPLIIKSNWVFWPSPYNLTGYCTVSSNSSIYNLSDNFFKVYEDGHIFNGNSINITRAAGGGARIYSYNLNVSDIANYTYLENSSTIWVIAPVSLLDLKLNGVSDNITVLTTQQVNATGFSDSANFSITRNKTQDVTSQSGLNVSLLEGYYEYWITSTGDENHSEDSEGIMYYANVTAPDTTSPKYSGLIIPSNGVYTSNYNFNTTINWSDNIGLDKVWVEHNFSGVMSNVSATNIGNSRYVFSITNFAAGSYSLRWYANDTNGNLNRTNQLMFNLSKANPLCYVNTSPISPITYSAQLNVTGLCTPSEKSSDLFRDNNGDLIYRNASNEYGKYVLLGVGTYHYVSNITSTQNYSNATMTPLIVVVQQSSNAVTLTLNSNPGNITILDNQSLNAVGYSASGNFKIFRNNVDITNESGIPIYLTQGLYQYKVNSTGNQNYSANGTGIIFTVNVSNTIVPDIQFPIYSGIINSSNNVYQKNENYSFNITWSDNIGIDKVWIEHNLTGSLRNTTIAISGAQYSFLVRDLGAGAYTYRWYANDTNGNVNKTGMINFTLSKSSVPCTLMISSNNITYPSMSNVTGSCVNNETNYNLYRNGILANNDNGNNIQLKAGLYNYTLNSSATGNFTATSISSLLEVQKATNKVNISINGGAANLTISDAQTFIVAGSSDSVNFNLYRGAVDMTSLSGTPINLSVGNYTFLVNSTGNENYTSNSTGKRLSVNVVSSACLINCPFTINLKSGINLVSIPLVFENNSIDAIFGPILSNINRIYSYNPQTYWSVYNTNIAMPKNFDTFDPYKAYFVVANNATSITLIGNVSYVNGTSPQYSYGVGWNLIGIQNLSQMSARNAFLYGIMPEVREVWALNSTNDYVFIQNSSTMLQPGQGYWVYFS